MCISIIQLDINTSFKLVPLLNNVFIFGTVELLFFDTVVLPRLSVCYAEKSQLVGCFFTSSFTFSPLILFLLTFLCLMKDSK